jgi:acetoacetyl-CoA reductase/3-oxoacyl-[acyl-carrier protein] reductase
MSGKSILITGSSRGIGANLVENFAKNGYKVAINYSKSEKEALDLYDKIALAVGKDSVLCIKADVGDRRAVKAMFDAIYGSFGSLDVIVNNAGINKDTPFIDMAEHEWSSVISTILTGAFNCSQEFARRFKGSAGHIVNIGAVTAISGRKNGVNYCTARAGILNFTHCLALELGPAICVNTVTPGYINTEEVMARRFLHLKENYDKAVGSIPAGRLGVPDDIFNAIFFLVNNATYITGQNIVVDGGYLMR